MVAMLPNVAQHGHTMVWHLMPFTKWIFELTLGQGQAKKVEIAFMAAWQWGPAHNCILQANNNLMHRQSAEQFPSL